jgi:protein-S-isoprenylcysteine O-methyltransferase Ste14
MNSIVLRIVSRLLGLPIIVGLILLLPAGTFDFWEVYAYFGILLILMVFAMVYFLKHDPELLKRRLEAKEKEDSQKMAVAIMALSILSIYILSGLDHRFDWSRISLSVQVVGFVLVVAGYLFVVQVMRTNSFAARTVRVEDSQTLVDTGLYGIVRHPMYSGVIVMYLGTPIALGSWWGLVPLLVFLLGLYFRVVNEEEVLLNELEGYGSYRERVRWRLIPGIL